MSQISVKGTVTVPAAGIANQLSGSNVEFINGPALISLWAGESAAGLELNFQNGAGATYLKDSEPNLKASAALDRQADVLLEQVFVNGAHLILQVTDTTGAGTTDLYYQVVVEPIPPSMVRG